MVEHTPRFLVVVMDSLRRDLLNPAIAPHLCEFLTGACDVPNARTVFPSETRVATTSFSTGAPPGVHGIVANTFFDPALPGGRPFNTGQTDMLALGTRAHDGRLVTAGTLGECLAAAGLTCAAVSTGTPGNARFVNPTARELGQVTVSVQGAKDSSPPAVFAEVTDRFGPVPKAGVPNLARCRYGADVLLDWLLPEVEPDVALIWFSEPDIAYHYRGIGSPESIEATRLVDAQFGRILDWCRSRSDAERWHVVAMSDHGQVTTTDQVDVLAEMQRAGFAVGDRLEPDVDYVGVPASSGNVWVRDGDRGRLDRLVGWMREQPWAGLLFTPGDGGEGGEGAMPGTLGLDVVSNAHARTSHLLYTLRTDDEANAHGAVGRTLFGTNDAVPAHGGGVHGGLHPKELANLIAFAGPAFRSGVRLAGHAGIVDVAPTILRTLGLAPATTMRGRAIEAALAGGDAADEPARPQVFEAGHGGYRQRLAVAETGGRHYLDGGWRIA